MGRTTAMKEKLNELGAKWRSTPGRDAVDHFGDPQGEYAALADGKLAIMERGERDTLILSGDDVIPWLQGLVTGDLHALVDEGNGQRNAWVNTTGRFVGEARLLHLPQMLFADLEAGALAGGLLSHLRRHIILEDVAIDDRSEQSARIGVYGEPAPAVVDQLANWQHSPADRPLFFGSWGRWKGQDLIVQHVQWNDYPGFEITCDVAQAPALVDALTAIDDSAHWMGHQAFEIHRLEAAIPRYGVELHDRVIPLEATFDDAIAFDKGCYLGQEIIARLDTLGKPAKLLRQVILDTDDVPTPKTEVYREDGEGRKIGHVESAVYSPRFEAALALAFVKRGHNDPGATITVDGHQGTLAPIHAFEAPPQ